MHLHTDFISIFATALGTLVVFHAMRAGGGALAAHGQPGAGKLITALATFN